MRNTTANDALRRAPAAFTLFVGVAIGLLIAALAVPDTVTRTDTVTAEGGAFGVEGEGVDGFDGAGGTGDGGTGDGSAGGTSGTGRSGGRASATGGGRTGGGVGGTSGGGGSGGTSAARGVGEDTIRIGVAIPDIGPFAVVPEFDLGDMQGHMEAILDRWRREGRTPVHGRDIEFVYRVFSIIGDEDVASCNGFVKDDQVFMVIGLRSYEGGAECLADRFDTPVVTLEFVNEQGEGAYERLHPWLITLRTSADRIARNFVEWAHRGGHLQGKTIGIYEGPDAGPTVAAVTAALERHGYSVAATASTDRKEGGPNDVVAVQRFRSNQVDLAILHVSALVASSFMENAQSQGYRPTYIDTDYGDHTSDVASTTHPAAQYDGTYAMTMTRVGEVHANGKLSPQGEACVSNYERFSGRDIDRGPPESAELVMMLQSCDEAELVITAIEDAGQALDRGSFISAIDAVTNLPGSSHGTYVFGPRKHHGAHSQRTVRWLGSCGCWTIQNPFGPLWVP